MASKSLEDKTVNQDTEIQQQKQENEQIKQEVGKLKNGLASSNEVVKALQKETEKLKKVN